MDDFLELEDFLKVLDEAQPANLASHIVVHEHRRPPIWAEEADGVHKRVKMIHDPIENQHR
ncbi:hypothetical protein HID58_013613 [Brassica napus]|uniref:Uncharacterized protein n=1 Tax=Brassica napus TaxID=3708 RepID=A0ABQ8E4D7_BRANA|nr:hypothetical protein HID58_013613 [Brassica napus]